MNCFNLCLVHEKTCRVCRKHSGCVEYSCPRDGKFCIAKSYGACDIHIVHLTRAYMRRKAQERKKAITIQAEWEENFLRNKTNGKCGFYKRGGRPKKV